MSSLHNQIHYGTNFLVALRKIAGLGDEDGVSRLGETLTPIIDMWALPESQLLRGDMPSAGSFDVTAVAGEFAQALLYNPQNSGVLVVVERINVWKPAAVIDVFMRLYRGASPAGFVTNNSAPIDTRSPQATAAAGTIALVMQDSVVGAIGDVNFDRLRGPADTIVSVPRPIILAPGTGVALNEVAQAGRILGSFYWRERRMLPREDRV